MTKPLARARCADNGFTLIEMIIAVTITTMILGALATVFVTSARSTSSTSHRSTQANDAQVISSFLIRDAQAAGGVDPQTGLNDTDLGVFTNAPIPGCMSGGSAISGTVLRFRWIDLTGTQTYYDAVYWRSGNRLVRTLCTTPTAGGSTTSSDADLANTIDATSPPVATCTTGSTTGACNSGAVGDTAEKIPDSVHLLITATRNSNPASGDLVGTYSYTLTANLRPARLAVSEIPNSENSASAVLITLGSACPGINLDPNAVLKVYGEVLVNQDAGCVTQANNTELDYHSLTTSSGVTNPLSSLQPPSSTGLTARSGCPGGIAQPGYYADAITLVNNASCIFQSGIYILNHGIVFGNGAAISTAAGGALFYFPNEPLSGGNNARINISAMTSGPYAGLAVWETVAGSTDLSNNGLLVINGTLYAPNAIIHFSNNAGSPQITAVIALGIDFKNNAAASFGPAPRALAVGAIVPSAWTFGTPFNPPIDATASGGFGTYDFGISGLSNLTIDDTTGLVSGAPMQTGNRTIRITLDDSFNDPQAFADFPITINPAMNITTSSPLPDAKQGVFYSTAPLSATGGTGARHWSATGLPTGMSIDADTGVISGTAATTGTSSAAVTVTDDVGATFTKNFSITVRPLITSVVLANASGGTLGTIEQGDTITVSFSGPMSVSTFCNTWSGNATDQILNADGDVTVNIADPNGNNPDIVTVTSATCTFNFGAIDLGSKNYVTSATTFTGVGLNKSTVVWTASTHTLVITLGAKATGGTPGTVNSSTPIYTSGGALRDATGLPISNSPFTLPTGPQF